jgi:hypothetical protein
MTTPAEVIARCEGDPMYFIERYFYIKHPFQGHILLDPYNDQRLCIRDFMGNRFNVIAKSRQVGCSTLAAAFALWTALFKPNRSVIIVSREHFARIVSFALDNLPQHITDHTSRVRSSTREIEFSNGSTIRMMADMTRRKQDLVCFTPTSLLIFDEAAFNDGFGNTMSSLFPTLQEDGRCIVMSTMSPRRDAEFEVLFKNAIEGKNSFNPIRLDWTSCPLRDDVWYEKMVNVLGQEGFDREYTCSL